MWKGRTRNRTRTLRTIVPALLASILSPLSPACSAPPPRTTAVSRPPEAEPSPPPDVQARQARLLDTDWWRHGDAACPPAAHVRQVEMPERLIIACVRNGAGGLPVEHGPAVAFYDNGAKEWEGLFENGQRHGLYREYFENGRKAREGRFDRGAPLGVHLRWDRSGGLLETVSYGLFE